MTKISMTKIMKLGKYDRICKLCGIVIKGASRECFQKGDTPGNICCDKNDNYWHNECEKSFDLKNSHIRSINGNR